MHSVNSKKVNSKKVNSKGYRLLRVDVSAVGKRLAAEMLKPCTLVGRAESKGITRKVDLARMSDLVGLAKSLLTRIRWRAVRVCGRRCFNGIAICRCSKPS